jgi:hypothetical protein
MRGTRGKGGQHLQTTAEGVMEVISKKRNDNMCLNVLLFQVWIGRRRPLFEIFFHDDQLHIVAQKLRRVLLGEIGTKQI